MARRFFLSVLAGAVVTVLGILSWRLPQHERVRSQISVLNDGGRAETFTIQWPRDRIVLPASRDPRLMPAGPAVALRDNAGRLTAVETFRVRDSTGHIIGVASRTISLAADAAQLRQGSDWILMIPSRGALFMSEINATDIRPRAYAAANSPIVAATDLPSTWGSTRQLQVSAGPGPDGSGSVLNGTEEFSGLTGSFVETWDLDQPSGGGRMSGRITLATELRTPPQ